MTAPASASGVPQLGPSLLPCPPPKRTKAIVYARMPVADITEVALGGLPQPRYRYGAAVAGAAGGGGGGGGGVPVRPDTEALHAEKLPAASRARTWKVYVVLLASPVLVKLVPVGLPTVVVPRRTW